MYCDCRSCRAQRAIRRTRHALRRRAKRLILGLVVVVLTTGGLTAGAIAAQRAIFPPEREAWFSNLLTLAQKADAEFDTLDAKWAEVGPQNWAELRELVREIVYQIGEEGATEQSVLPTDLVFMDFGPGARSAVAGRYYANLGAISLNERYLTSAWADQSWLGVLVHELVHAQGYFVGSSPTLESQTEIVAAEVLAAMANLNYPGARAELLDGLRRDALSMAYYIARFGGSPIHTTYVDDLVIPGSFDADPALMARLDAVRAAVFTPTELARAEKRIRWWNEQPVAYRNMLSKYVVTTLTMELDAACGSGSMSESFQQYRLIGQITSAGSSLGLSWGVAVSRPPFQTDDLAYVLKDELGYCR